MPDEALCDAVLRAGRGQVDADLGGGVIKQRIAREGEGRSGGFRAIVLFRLVERAFFVHGFAKNDRENLRLVQPQRLRVLRELARELLGLDEARLEVMLTNGTISEVTCDG